MIGPRVGIRRPRRGEVSLSRLDPVRSAMLSLLSIVLVSLASLSWGQPDPAPPAAPQAAAAAAPPAQTAAAADKVARFASADELLGTLETADRDLRSFAADVQYKKRFADIQGGDAQTRQGRLSFATEPRPEADAVPRRSFAVIFTTLIVDNARRDETTKFVFDGEWLVEQNDTTKQFLKRRVVPAGKIVDPLKIGEGPFVLPIGQKKAEILRRFDAELLSIDDGLTADDASFKRALEGTVQLRLVPKPGLTEARDFEEIRLWYRLDDLLPRAARTRTPNGAASEVLLINQSRNGPIDKALFSIEPPDGGDWDIDIRDDVRAAPGDADP